MDRAVAVGRDFSRRMTHLLSETRGLLDFSLKKEQKWGELLSNFQVPTCWPSGIRMLHFFSSRIRLCLYYSLDGSSSFPWRDLQDKVIVRCQSLEHKCLFLVDPHHTPLVIYTFAPPSAFAETAVAFIASEELRFVVRDSGIEYSGKPSSYFLCCRL